MHILQKSIYLIVVQFLPLISCVLNYKSNRTEPEHNQTKQNKTKQHPPVKFNYKMLTLHLHICGLSV